MVAMIKTSRFISLIVFLVLISSCDFTPRLHKEILMTQEYMHKQQYDKAVLKYQEILKDPIPIEIRTKIYYQLGDIFLVHFFNTDKAIEFFELIKKESEDPLWLVKAEEKLGEINFTYLKKYEKSAENYEKLMKFVPKLDKIDYYQFRYALSLLKCKKLDESLKLFNEIISNGSHKHLTKSFYYIGKIFFSQKEWAKAIKYWNEYLKRERRKDNMVQVKFLMANAYETMEELKKAYDIYYSILGEYPNTEVVQNRLNSIYARKIARKR